MNNNYVKSIIRREKAKQIEEVFQEIANYYSDDITAKNLKENIFSGSYLRNEIEIVLEKFGD